MKKMQLQGKIDSIGSSCDEILKIADNCVHGFDTYGKVGFYCLVTDGALLACHHVI